MTINVERRTVAPIIQKYPRNRTFNVTVGTVAQKFLSENSRRTKLYVQNNSANIIEMVESESSAFGTGIQITAGGATLIDDANVNQGTLHLIANGAASDVRIREEYNESG